MKFHKMFGVCQEKRLDIIQGILNIPSLCLNSWFSLSFFTNKYFAQNILHTLSYNLNKMIWWNLPSVVEIVFKRKLRSALCYRFFGWFLLREREGANYVICINWLSINVQSAYYFITMTQRRDNAIFAYFKWRFSNKKRSTLEKMQVFLAVHFVIDPLSKMYIWYWANTRKHKDTTRITFNQ